MALHGLPTVTTSRSHLQGAPLIDGHNDSLALNKVADMGAASGFVWRSMPQSGVLGGPLSCQHNAGSGHCRARHDHTAIHVLSATWHDGKICALDLASAVARGGRCVGRSLAWTFCESISWN